MMDKKKFFKVYRDAVMTSIGAVFGGIMGALIGRSFEANVDISGWLAILLIFGIVIMVVIGYFLPDEE